MKNISQPQQFRRVTGEFLATQDKISGNEQQQQARISALAKHPGRNSSNANQQDLAHSILNLFSLLSTIRPAPERINSSGPINTLTRKNNIAQGYQHEDISLHSQGNILSDRVAIPDIITSGSQLLSPHSAAHKPLAHDYRKAESLSDANNISIKTSESTQVEPELLIDKKNKILDAWLMAMDINSQTEHKLERLNNIANYMAADVDKRTTEIAKLLLSASNSYGAEDDEMLSHQRKWLVIADYFNQVIFGMNVEAWLLQKMQKIKTYENHLYHHKNLQRAFTNRLNAYHAGEVLSPGTRKFYQEKILANLLPTFMLQLNRKEQSELAHMDIGKVQWGFIHAGARLLNYFGNDARTLKLEELAEVGVTLDILLRQGAVPQEYLEFFFLPALFYHAENSRQSETGSELNAQHIEQLFIQYFEHSEKWIKQHNPIALLDDLVKQWKTRPELAQEILSDNDIPFSFLNTYLNRHEATNYHYYNGTSVNLPDIDGVFEQQNKKIEKTALEADKLIISAAFQAVSQDTQAFIANALINKVQARFSAAKAIHGIPLSKSTKMGIDNSGALERYIPDQYDLLQCINNGEERIYILQARPNGEYSLTHANSLRKDMFWLLDDFTPGGFDDYELKIIFDKKLKSKEEAPAKVIQKLATLHSAKLKAALSERGYQKTLDEKVKDFLLGLIPFYTCITESIKNNSEAAVPACIMDVLNLVPITGAAVTTGVRFGTALTKTTALALTWGSRQATLKNMFRQAGKIYVNQFPSIATEISPRIMKNLAMVFLRSIDPGIEFLTKGSLKGAKALEKVITNIQQKGSGLTSLANSLTTLINAPLAEPVTSKYQTKTLFSKPHGRELNFAAIDDQNGKKVWVQFDSETGELFGRKYFITDQGIPEPVPFSLATRIKLIKSEGLGGKGALKKTWPDDGQIAGPSNANSNAVPVIKTDTINNFPVKIWSFGEPGSEILLYPENNQIRFSATPIDLSQYKQSYLTLSPAEQAALIEWMGHGEPLFFHSDGTYESSENISLEINEKLIKGIPLTPYEKFTYENLLAAINSKKIAGVPGDYLHVTYYKTGFHNPWVNGAIAINDYVTNFPVIMSFSCEPKFAATVISEAYSTREDIDSFIFYKIENARNIFPLLSSALGSPVIENEFIYPPRTILKVKSFSLSQPAYPEQITGENQLHRAIRVGIILTEVDANEAAQVTMVKNLFTGIKIPLRASRPLLPAYNIIPSLPINRRYWDNVREMITPPLIPPPLSVTFTQIQKLEKFIPEIPIQVSADTNIITQKTKEHLQSYFSNHKWRAYIGLSGNVPPEIAWIQKIIRHHCEESLRKLVHVDTILSDIPEESIIDSDIGKYIIGLTPTNDPVIVKEIFHRIAKIFKRARIFMEAAKKVDYSNFIIASTDLFPVSDARQRYISLLSDGIIKRLPKACTHKFDPESRIVIFADQFLGNSPEGKGERLSLSSSNEFKLYQTIIHETTHLSSLTSDLFVHAIPTRDTKYSALYARQNFLRALTPSNTPQKTSPIWKSPDFVKFMQNVVDYQNVNTRLDYSSVITTIQNDPMLSANIFYSDAEVIALIANDIDAKRSFDALSRSKRKASTDSVPDGYNADDTQLLLAFILDATTNGLIHLNSETPEKEKSSQSIQALKRKKLGGVTMDLQIYGDTDNSELLFLEGFPWKDKKLILNKKSLKHIITTLSPRQKKALRQWPEFADQHHLTNAITARPTINEKVIKNIALNTKEKNCYADALEAIQSGKIPGVAGNFLRVVHYAGGQKNPWLNDDLDINDVLTTSKAFMSVSSDAQFSLSQIADLGDPEKKIASIVFYKVENGTKALPLLPLAHAPANIYDEYLYPPDSLFKVKSLAISVPVLTEAGHNNSDLYRAQRVAVTLTELSAEEAKNVKTIKSIFDGSATHYLI